MSDRETTDRGRETVEERREMEGETDRQTCLTEAERQKREGEGGDTCRNIDRRWGGGGRLSETGRRVFKRNS